MRMPVVLRYLLRHQTVVCCLHVALLKTKRSVTREGWKYVPHHLYRLSLTDMGLRYDIRVPRIVIVF